MRQQVPCRCVACASSADLRSLLACPLVHSGVLRRNFRGLVAVLRARWGRSTRSVAGRASCSWERSFGLGARGGGRRVINALGVVPGGTRLGSGGLRYWGRPRQRPRSRCEQKRDSHRLAPRDKETQHWVDVIQEVSERFDRNRASAWFV